MLAFGGNLTGFTFLNYFARNADNILIGWYSGAGPLGFYSKSYQLLLLPIGQVNAPVSAVALPGLSRLQNEPERFRRYYFKAIGLLAFIGMPAVAFLVVEARPVVLLALGEGWLPAIPIFRALGAAAFIGTLNVAAGWVYVALGRTKRQLKWGVIAVPLQVLSFVVGLRWGAQGVAWAYSAIQCLLFPFGMLFCYRGTFLSASELLQTVVRPAVVSVVSAIALVGAQNLVPIAGHAIIEVGIGVIIFALFYVSMWLSLPGGAIHLREYLDFLRAPFQNEVNRPASEHDATVK
jgi:PST family polysaccharide transporter